MEEFLKAAEGNLPTLRGIKYTSADLMDFCRCLVYNEGKYEMMYGVDQVVIDNVLFDYTYLYNITFSYTSAPG